MLVGLSYVFLSLSSEDLSVAEIARRQQQTGYLYSSGLSDGQTHLYKLALYQEIKPDVIALGSSRVLQFRGEDFHAPFVNMGLSMSSIEQGHQVVDAMLETGHVPKLVFLGADFWWFSADRGRTVHRKMTEESNISFRKLLEPYRLLVRGKVSPELMMQVFGRAWQGTGAGYGLIAVAWQDGYDRYGSRHYTSMIEGRRPSDHIPRDVKAKIDAGVNLLNYKGRLDSAAVESYRELVNKLKKAGSHVIVIIPPSFNKMNHAVESLSTNNLIPDFRRAMHMLGVPVHDFHNHEDFAPKCELLDAWHGGEVSYLRILLHLARHDKAVRSVLDVAELEALVRKNKGQAAIHRNGYPVARQVDFLYLGCPEIIYAQPPSMRE